MAARVLSRLRDISAGPIVFQTVNAHVRLIDSAGVGLAGGEAKYYAGSWKTLGTTDANGDAYQGTFAGEYKVRMTYGGKSIEQSVISAPAPSCSKPSMRMSV
jgi:hypothetical protein